jgi:hypothetical protein
MKFAFMLVRPTLSLSHSRRMATLPRSQRAANLSRLSKAKGSAAVGCREVVRQCETALGAMGESLGLLYHADLLARYPHGFQGWIASLQDHPITFKAHGVDHELPVAHVDRVPVTGGDRKSRVFSRVRCRGTPGQEACSEQE